MSRRSSVGFAMTPVTSKRAGRHSIGSRRSIGGAMGPPATPPNATPQSATTSEFLEVPENNDEEERRQRQLSRLQQLQSSRQLSSPTVAALDSDGRRKSVSTLEPRLTGQQLTQHYAKCIQLSAENKINIKNAFNLQLIDYMTEMLKRKDSEMNNFQVASCTLDASTKIYAYRVDCVHTDTMRMAGGLGRTQQDRQQAGAEQGAALANKRRRTKKRATLESNPNSLALPSIDLDFMVDPLFKKISSEFDEGRAGGGLFLNSLILRDDSCQLLLNSDAVLDIEPSAVSDATTRASLPLLPDTNKCEICPVFTNFQFNNWKVEDMDSTLDSNDNAVNADDLTTLVHAFDVNAVPEPLEDDPHHADEFGGAGDDGYDEDDTVAATIGEGGNNTTCLTVGWGGQHAASTTGPPPVMETIHLKEHLASIPLEYSYFDAKVMSAWAGPGHWKLKPAIRDKTKSFPTTTEGGKKRKKYHFEVDFTLTTDIRESIDEHFEPSKKMTKLSQNTIRMWCEDNTTLPVDLHFDPSDFAKLHSRSEVVVRRQVIVHEQTIVQTFIADDASEPIAQHEDDQEDDHGHDAGDCDISGVGYNMTMFSQTLMGPSQAQDFLGDNLVQAPNKVAKIHIGYARTAKRMDMKKLKTQLWDMLSNTTTGKENDSNSANVVPAAAIIDKERMSDGETLQFSDVYRRLPHRLTHTMAENLSLPLAFIALLHLCNEKNLALVSMGKMEDFTIKQG